MNSYMAGLNERLKDKEYAAGYLNEILLTNDNFTVLTFLRGLDDVSRVHLGKGLPNMHPSFSSIYLVLKELGMELTICPPKKNT